ncbi:MAG: hypothetical protein JW699_02900 [Chitinispirillaceae bacterium]|nr:hypothetical protein [Chitinispirillaceae bacterium]
MDILNPAIIEAAKVIGFGMVVFVIWVLTIRFFEKVMAQQQEQFDRFIDELSKRNDENFQVLNKFAEASEYAGGQISNLASEIRNNNYCPIIREQQEKK